MVQILFNFAFEPRHKTVGAPKLNVVPIDKPFGFLDCLRIVGADQRFKSVEMPIKADGVGAVFCQPDSPHCRMALS
jgi:hypothetical protein